MSDASFYKGWRYWICVCDQCLDDMWYPGYAWLFKRGRHGWLCLEPGLSHWRRSEGEKGFELVPLVGGKR